MTAEALELPHDPEQLEMAYQRALKSGTVAAFVAALEAGYIRQPDNLLLAAWHYRLAYAAVQIKRRIIAWRWAVPLAVLNGLLFWGLSAERFSVPLERPLEGTISPFLPHLVLLWAPLAAVFVVLFLALAGGGRWRRAVLAAALPLALAGYVLLVYPQAGPRVFQEQYLILAGYHLPLTAWAGVGFYLLRGHRHATDRFAFLLKSLEVFVLGGLMIALGGVFTTISLSLFEALAITPPEPVVRLFLAGGIGLIPVLAVAILYDPTAAPAEQAFAEGLSRLIALLMRLLLPLTLVVLVIYLGLIPFNFRQPFLNRDVLIIYNVMLFAVVALLVAATPMSVATAHERPTIWLRRGLLALAGMALLIGLYALAAILYRTSMDKLTPNRLTFIGWNLINIGVLVGLLVTHLRQGPAGWPFSFQRTFAAAMFAYVLWTLVVLLVIPWMFPVDRQAAASLPVSIRRIVYDRPYPILLRCSGSPHIYLLSGSEKRWIKDIPTFEAQGFRWDDVQKVECSDLRAVPDGLPIPPDAGPPPTP
jgi:hypothetical protein